MPRLGQERLPPDPERSPAICAPVVVIVTDVLAGSPPAFTDEGEKAHWLAAGSPEQLNVIWPLTTPLLDS